MNFQSRDWTLSFTTWNNLDPVEHVEYYFPEEFVEKLLQVSSDTGLDFEAMLSDMVSLYVRTTGDSNKSQPNVSADVPALTSYAASGV